MTQKHFTEFAAMIKSEMDEIEAERTRLEIDAERHLFTLGKRHQIKIIANRMANIMAADNPRFKRDKFLSACGVQS